MSNIMLGDALRELRGPIDDLFSKLTGPDGETVWWPGFKKFLRKENPWSAWRTTKLGAFKSADDFRVMFNQENCRISDWASDLMSKPDFVKSLEGVNPDEEFDLAVMTTSELVGENRNASTAEVFAGAERLGLKKCPAWMGPKLRLDYKNQPKGEWLLIGMEPICYSDGHLHVFAVERHDSDLWLYSYSGYPRYVWDAGCPWVFVRPRK